MSEEEDNNTAEIHKKKSKKKKKKTEIKKLDDKFPVVIKHTASKVRTEQLTVNHIVDTGPCVDNRSGSASG